MAEFLVYAKTHWMEDIKPEIRDRWSDKIKAAYNRRLIPGSPVVVRPNGWKWGRGECPPVFVVVKAPSLSMKDAQKYVEPSLDFEKKILGRRRYLIDPGLMANAKISAVPVVFNKKIDFENAIIDRDV